MKIIWLGHASFRIEIEDQILLIDPWFTGNPVFPQDKRDQAIKDATAILVSHGHGDHAADALGLARATGARILCIHELANLWSNEEGVTVTGFGKGGTVSAGAVDVTLVNAVHSSSIDYKGEGRIYAGTEAGFMIAGEGHVIYFSGDTDVMADMGVFNDLHEPDIGILSAGGHYTMDMRRAAYACNKFFDFSMVIPCHYKTFPLLAQDAQVLIDALEPGIVVEPEILVPIEIAAKSMP